MKEQTALENLNRETCVIKSTHTNKGRNISVTPENTATRFLYYGRIILEASDAIFSFENKSHETGLICLNGSAKVETGGNAFNLERYDSLYVPRDSKIEITPGAEGCDFAEVSAEVEKQYPLQFVAFEEIRQN